MSNQSLGSEEIARRGEEIYAQKLRNQIEAENIGKILVIDIENQRV